MPPGVETGPGTGLWAVSFVPVGALWALSMALGPPTPPWTSFRPFPALVFLARLTSLSAAVFVTLRQVMPCTFPFLGEDSLSQWETLQGLENRG